MDWRTCAFILVFVQCWDHIKTGSASGSATSSSHNITSDFFVEQLIQQYGTTGTIDVNQLNILLQSIHNGRQSSKESHVSVPVATNGNEYTHEKKPHSGVDANRACQLNWHNDSTCLQTKCLSASNIFQFHSISPRDKANATHMREMSATILYQAQNTGCISAEENEEKKHKGPSHAEMWGYSFLCVTLINLCSLLGVVFLPFMQKKYYKKVLMYMVALAVGTLAGSSLLFLIPDSLHLAELIGESYIWKSTMVIGGIYMFFLVERLLKIIMEIKENRGDKTDNGLPVCSASIPTHERKHHDSMSMTFDVPLNPKDNTKADLCGSESSHVLMKDGQPNTTDIEKVASNGNGMVHTTQDPASQPHKIRSVAWMVIFGDGLHNFIDGLSIGAAFADRTLAGISVSLAVICEELPHELGDFAILLNSGMTMRQALKYNFLSACMCYLGMVLGILVGENTMGSSWIFALAGGMFLYISLVDMLPEVNHAAEEEGPSIKAKLKVFVLQNLGLITGYCIILVMAIYSSKISLE